ncbi:two-component system response regulator CreB [Enterobacter roggenkampii]|uniref:two-component system response regulator CreB n=1 Tax=Enterobacter roggenkampii TaxID=1812935 RepID=UPI0007B33D07|nr:two-component system response regulator CreB [Enterobacter roggenkampii]KZP84208.1 two-component system response regulator CreB [Enterobacter roggenkampii]
MQQPVVWLVEDETSIADTLIYMLQQEGFAVKAFERGLPVLEEARRQVPALAILDVGLPDISGFELCRRLLAQHPSLPVLFLTARRLHEGRKVSQRSHQRPFPGQAAYRLHHCARVRTILRRMQKSAVPSETLRIGQFELNEPAARISWCGEALPLTRYEFLLLKTLLQAPGRVFSRQQLMDKVWGEDGDSFDRTVDTHIKTLRAKLRAVNEELSPISTHRGMGYSLGLY